MEPETEHPKKIQWPITTGVVYTPMMTRVTSLFSTYSFLFDILGCTDAVLDLRGDHRMGQLLANVSLTDAVDSP